MGRALYFLRLKLAEAGTMFIVFCILFWLSNDTYWPGRPSDPLVIAAGAAWTVIMLFFVWGYIVTSAVAFVLVAKLGDWRPGILGMAMALAFAAHSLALIKLFKLNLDGLSWMMWIFFIVLNAVVPYIEFRGRYILVPGTLF